MTDESRSVPTAHFEALYARSPDPWHFETSDYERRKYAMTLASLPRERYARGFELGCSIGVLTAALAERCDWIIGGDCSPAAIAMARERDARGKQDQTCREQAKTRRGSIEFAEMRAPGTLPAGRFDLIVLSEVLYFLSHADLQAVAAFCASRLEPDGTIVLVNYLGSTDGPTSGDGAAKAFLHATAAWACCVRHHRDDAFRLDVLEHRPQG